MAEIPFDATSVSVRSFLEAFQPALTAGSTVNKKWIALSSELRRIAIASWIRPGHLACGFGVDLKDVEKDVQRRSVPDKMMTAV